MFRIRKNPSRDLEKAKSVIRAKYEACKNFNEITKESEVVRFRMAMQILNHLDKTFINGAKEIEYFENKHAGKRLKNKSPTASEFLRFESKLNGTIFTWVPFKFTQKIYALGQSYQKAEIDKTIAITNAQVISNQISVDLNLGFDVEVVLRIHSAHGVTNN